jgi:hypothetical protein
VVVFLEGTQGEYLGASSGRHATGFIGALHPRIQYEILKGCPLSSFGPVSLGPWGVLIACRRQQLCRLFGTLLCLTDDHLTNIKWH